MPARFEDKVLYVSGAADGIGRAAAQLACEQGAAVVAVDTNEALLEQSVAELRAAGHTAVACIADVADSDAVGRSIDVALDTYGRIDCALNNAGILGASARPLAEHSDDDFRRVWHVNVSGIWHSMKRELQEMLKSGGGSIVNTASVGGIVGGHGIAPYVASKHAVVGLTRAAALDYAKASIRVNAIAPGATDTAMMSGWLAMPGVRELVEGGNPAGRMAEPAEPAAAALWLLSDEASYVTGAVLVVDGGRTAG